MFFILFLTIAPEGPWTKEIRSLNETIQAYSMLDTEEQEDSSYTFHKTVINLFLVSIRQKINYLAFSVKDPYHLSSFKKTIYHKNKIFSE